MSRYKQARTAALRGPLIDAKHLPAIAAIPLTARWQSKDLLSTLESLLQPGVSRRRDIQVSLEPFDLVRTIEDPATPAPMRAVLDRFLIALFFARRTSLFPDADGAPTEAYRKLRDRVETGAAGPVPTHLLQAGPDIASLFRACLAYAGRAPDRFDAWDAARLAHRDTPRTDLRPDHRGLAFARPFDTLAEIAEGPRSDAARTRRARLDIAPGPDFATDLPVCLVGVDRGYFDLYAPRLIETAKGIANLHFHVANPGTDPLPRHDHVRYSTEDVPHDPAYFASMRFLHLPALLEAYGRRIIVLDADARFSRPLTDYIDRFQGHELGININDTAPSQYFWRHYNAQILTAEPTHAVVRLLETVERLFDALYRPNRKNWWIDQAVLAQAIALAEADGTAPKLFSNRFAKITGIKQGKLPGPKARK